MSLILKDMEEKKPSKEDEGKSGTKEGTYGLYKGIYTYRSKKVKNKIGGKSIKVNC